MLVNTKEIFKEAISSRHGIGAFNFSNMETLQAIVEAANEENVSCIIQASESAIKYMGIEYLVSMVKTAEDLSRVPLVLHLDHGKNFDICKNCIDKGFTSVMIDGSSMSFESNISITKQVVEYAKPRGISVEAELGILSGIEDDIKVKRENSFLTDPKEAAIFVERTGIDSLAVAIGTSHGLNKGNNTNPKLDIKRLAEIRSEIGYNFPLVLHGASSVYSDITEKCNELGANIKGAFGIKDEDIKLAIQNGIVKINVDTDIRMAFLAGILDSFKQTEYSIDLRKHLGNAKKVAKEVIKRKIISFR